MYVNTSYYSATKKHRLAILGEEFSYKVQFDFKRILFIGVLPNYIKDFSEIVELASKQNGYQAHRSINYREHIYHVYIRYSTTSEAISAKQFFRAQNGLNAEIVDDILKAWYGYEMTSEQEHRPTVCYLDIVGEVSYTEPLSDEIARSMLKKFGEPEILHVQSDYVKAAFSSIAEGIGACVMYGRWFVKSTPQDLRFFYRVQLERSNYFSEMVNHSGNPAAGRDTLQLDYFSPRVPTPTTSVPIFEYENANPNNDYLAAQEPRNSRHFYRGRGNYRFQRGGKSRGKNYNQSKFRNNGYQQFPMAYAPVDPNVEIHQSSNPPTHNSARNPQSG